MAEATVFKSTCHICGVIAPQADMPVVKCKLCCDGLEQDFCPVCAKLESTFKRNLGLPEGNAAFRALQARRMAWGSNLRAARVIRGEACESCYGDHGQSEDCG